MAMSGTEAKENAGNKDSFEVKLEAAVNERMQALEDAQKGIIRDVNGIKLSIYDAGEFVDKKTGETLEFDAGIKIKIAGSYVKPSAVQMATLFQAFADVEVKSELHKRLLVEQEAVKSLHF